MTDVNVLFIDDVCSWDMALYKAKKAGQTLAAQKKQEEVSTFYVDLVIEHELRVISPTAALPHPQLD